MIETVISHLRGAALCTLFPPRGRHTLTDKQRCTCLVSCINAPVFTLTELLALPGPRPRPELHVSVWPTHTHIHTTLQLTHCSTCTLRKTNGHPQTFNICSLTKFSTSLELNRLHLSLVTFNDSPLFKVLLGRTEGLYTAMFWGGESTDQNQFLTFVKSS